MHKSKFASLFLLAFACLSPFSAMSQNAAAPGTYNFADVNGNTLDAGWHDIGDSVMHEWSFNNNFHQQYTLSASGTLCDSVSGGTGLCLYDNNGTLSQGGSDTFTVASSGSGFTLFDNQTQRYVNPSGGQGQSYNVTLSNNPSLWNLTIIQVNLSPGTYAFQDPSHATLDSGWQPYGDPRLHEWGYNDNPYQQFTLSSSGTLCSGGSGLCLYDNNGTLSQGGSDTFTVTSFGSGYLLQDNQTHRYINPAGGQGQGYLMTLSSSPASSWTAVPVSSSYNVSPSMNESEVQEVVNAACQSGHGNVVQFAAGNYTGWTSTISVPAANGCVIQGPVVNSQPVVPAALLNSDGGITTTNPIFALTNCSGATPGASATIEYLTFDNTTGVYVPASCGGFEIQYNQFENNNPSVNSSWSYASIVMDGTGSAVNSGWDISWNDFANNCADRDAVYDDLGGICAATFINASAAGATWNNNTVNNMEQGFKIATTDGSYILNVTSQGNYFNQIHRIAQEWQTASSATMNNVVQYNYVGPPLNPCWYSFAISVPLWGTGQPASTSIDNTIVAGTPVDSSRCSGSGGHYGIGMEVWGNGAAAQYNLMEGGSDPNSGYSPFSLGAGSGANITNNTVCGYDANALAANNNGSVVGIDSSQGAPTGYSVTPNTLSQNCPTLTIPTPTISAASGSAVTITDSRSNATIYYTLDGSTPNVNSLVYTGPFTPSGPVTINAIAQWGTGANVGIQFPAGYGYTASAVASADY